MKKISILLALLFMSKSTQACSVCFIGDSNPLQSRALEMGMLLLLAVLAIILGLFATFFIKFAKREKQLTENL